MTVSTSGASSNHRLSQRQLHQVFLQALEGMVVNHGDVTTKPLDIDLRLPLPPRVRLYMYNATEPPGGRTLGEHKIQLIVPGQRRGQRGAFDHGDGRVALLVGYQRELEVFILWDAGRYPEFTYSRNVQVKAESVIAALANDVGQQERRIRGQGTEVVMTARPCFLAKAITLQVDQARRRLIGD